jgi:hypothetical protein
MDLLTPPCVYRGVAAMFFAVRHIRMYVVEACQYRTRGCFEAKSLNPIRERMFPDGSLASRPDMLARN